MKRSEIFIQDSISSCGAACIASIVKHYGGYVPLETIKLDTKTDKSGTNAFEIVKTLKKYGFNSYGEYKQLSNINKFPVISHTNINGYYHFIVIYNIKDNKVYTMDPRFGYKIYNLDYYNTIYTGIIINSIPYRKINIEINNKYNINTFISYKKLIPIFSFNIIIIFIETFISLYIKTSNIINNNYIFIILSFILYIFIFLKNKIIINIDNKVSLKLNSFFFNHIFRLDYKYIINKRIGEIIKKVEDLNFIKSFYLNFIYNELFNIVISILCLVIIFIISKNIFLISLIFILIYIYLTVLYAKKVYKLNNDTIYSYNYYYGNLSECLNNYESIRNINDLDYLNNKIHKSYKSYLYKNKILSNYINNTSSLIGFIFNIKLLIINIISFLYINNNMLSLSDYIVIITVLNIFNNNINSMSEFINNYMHFKGLKEGVRGFLNIEEINYIKEVKTFKTISLKDIKYTYDYNNYILNNITLNINKGDKILIKGNSGVGKSTLVKILCGNLDDYEGKIFLNNNLINNNILKNITIYIGQNENLFMGSIKENITLNKPGDLDKAINICELNEFINKKDNKLEYMILEGSTNISFGERSRIILARALYKNPKILIIDETLSGVSSKQEDRILSNLLKINDLTLIYITHRDKDKYFKKIINL